MYNVPRTSSYFTDLKRFEVITEKYTMIKIIEQNWQHLHNTARQLTYMINLDNFL